jgi:hypothetical protein
MFTDVAVENNASSLGQTSKPSKQLLFASSLLFVWLTFHPKYSQVIGSGLVNIFIDHLQVVTTNNYNTIADFHTKSSVSFHSSLLGNNSQQWLFLCNSFTRRFLVTNLNNGDSSASVVTPLPAGYHSTTELSTEL